MDSIWSLNCRNYKIWGREDDDGLRCIGSHIKLMILELLPHSRSHLSTDQSDVSISPSEQLNQSQIRYDNSLDFFNHRDIIILEKFRI